MKAIHIFLLAMVLFTGTIIGYGQVSPISSKQIPIVKLTGVYYSNFAYEAGNMIYTGTDEVVRPEFLEITPDRKTAILSLGYKGERRYWEIDTDNCYVKRVGGVISYYSIPLKWEGYVDYQEEKLFLRTELRIHQYSENNVVKYLYSLPILSTFRHVFHNLEVDVFESLLDKNKIIVDW